MNFWLHLIFAIGVILTSIDSLHRIESRKFLNFALIQIFEFFPAQVVSNFSPRLKIVLRILSGQLWYALASPVLGDFSNIKAVFRKKLQIRDSYKKQSPLFDHRSNNRKRGLSKCPLFGVLAVLKITLLGFFGTPFCRFTDFWFTRYFFGRFRIFNWF